MSETLFYFGILHGMKIKSVRERREFLKELLELPDQNKLIRTLRCHAIFSINASRDHSLKILFLVAGRKGDFPLLLQCCSNHHS